MAEKKGNTVKLKYDFPTQLCCEIYQESLGAYYRVTCNEFRSFGGKRRILNIDDPKMLTMKITMVLSIGLVQIKK